jgi:hypothetical protein
MQSNEFLVRLLRAELTSLDMAACPGGPDCFAIEILHNAFNVFKGRMDSKMINEEGESNFILI